MRGSVERCCAAKKRPRQPVGLCLACMVTASDLGQRRAQFRIVHAGKASQLDRSDSGGVMLEIPS
jgi:hypothetical protein